MRKLYLVLLLIIFSSSIFSQLPVLQWTAVMPSTSPWDNDNARSVGVDAQGNVYAVGLFMNTEDFDPGPGVFMLTAQGPYNYGIFIVKLSPTGQFIWAKQLPVLVEWSAIELTVDHAGNAYVTSNFNAPADMDPGPGVVMLSPIGAKDAFVLKLDANGNFVWAKQFGGPGDTVAEPTSIDIDANGNVYTSGTFINTVDFDPGGAVANLTTYNHWEGYISKLTNNGDFVWAKQIGDFGSTYGSVTINRVKCDAAGNCFYAGTFGGNCDFDPTPAQFRIQSLGSFDGFVASIDMNGNFKWAKQIGNSTLNYYINHQAITIDANNNVYSSGTFTGTQDFDPGPNNFILTANGTVPYLLKLDASGNFLWAKRVPVTGNGGGAEVAVDNVGNVYTTANYDGDIDFGPGPGTTTFSGTYDDNILTKFTPDGTLMYVAPFLRTPDGYMLGRRMVIDPALNIYMTGYVYGNIDFDPGPGVSINPILSGQSPYVLKLSRCMNATSSTMNVSSCDTFMLNGHRYDTSGTYVQTIINAAGCDSVITLNLTINKRFTQQAKSICDGESFFAGGANQTTSGTYVDTLQSSLGCDSIVTTHLSVNARPAPLLGTDKNICENQSLVLSPGVFSTYLWQDGSTQNSFTVTTPGLYYVSVTNTFNCRAADTIHIRTLLSSPKNFLKESDTVCIYKSILIEPFNNYSQYVWSNGSTQKNISVNTPGIYWLKVKDANGCDGSDSINILSKECTKGVFIPSAFSPNGDRHNDLFHAIVVGNIKSFHLQVFNRWGTLVFDTTDPTKGWDGSVNGKTDHTSTFVWLCTYQLDNDPIVTEKGTLILIR